MKLSMSLWCLLLATLSAQPLAAQDPAPPADSAAQDPAPPADSDADNTVVITGERPATEKAIVEGVEQIFPGGDMDDPIARFHDPVCLGFAGLSAGQEAVFRDTIEARGGDAGVRFARGRCTTNALVVVVDDPAAFVAGARRKQVGFISPADHRRFDAAIAQGDPVFAWTTQEPRTALGGTMPGTNVPGSGALPSRIIKVNNYAVGRRSGSDQSAAITQSVVVFDAARVEGLTLAQLADYAAMRLLAPSRITARWQGERPGSILKLFSGDAGQAEPAMTLFDEAYLAALYDLPLNASPGRLKPAVLAAYAERTGD